MTHTTVPVILDPNGTLVDPSQGRADGIAALTPALKTPMTPMTLKTPMTPKEVHAHGNV
ncbi:hypothetical protein BJG92_02459 [Arthrobacter sp. SO5]|uniref:hypothetical protein n=1 Tax=Arthrobacter sp. SO5 TaxID=1897055 RepID=UPI001E3D5A83|nr:hypothetical protein [Arthrobacter sp. SO5]MCB5274921.1 hypothetical protein [Arthrobacter sp. SO5]